MATAIRRQGTCDSRRTTAAAIRRQRSIDE
jgi:hypothetical protein